MALGVSTARANNLRAEVRSDIVTDSQGQPAVFAIANAVYHATLGSLKRQPGATQAGVRPEPVRTVEPIRPHWPAGFVLEDITEKPAPPAPKSDFQSEITSASRMVETSIER